MTLLLQRYVVEMETDVLENTHQVFQRLFFMLLPHTKKLHNEKKRKRKETEEQFELLSERLDEETRARKILEQKLASHFPSTSEFHNSSQARCSTSSISLGKESQVLPTSTKCLLKNFRKGVVALGYVRRDVQSCEDTYMVRMMIYLNQQPNCMKEKGHLETLQSAAQFHGPRTLLR